VTDDNRGNSPHSDRPEGQEQSSKPTASLGEKAKSIAERQMTAGVGAIDSVGRVVRKVAEDIESDLPGIAPYVADAASGIESASTKIRDRSIGEIVEMVADFGRKQPATFMAGAVVFGLLLSRFVKSGTTSGPPGESVHQRGSEHHG
jgi:hypothetical protein